MAPPSRGWLHHTCLNACLDQALRWSLASAILQRTTQPQGGDSMDHYLFSLAYHFTEVYQVNKTLWLITVTCILGIGK